MLGIISNRPWLAVKVVVSVGTYTIVNEQTYASTLVDNYLVPLNNGSRDLDDVTCGATYGAKLVRDMVNEAQEWCNGIIIE